MSSIDTKRTNPDEPRLAFSVPEVARLLGLSRRQIYVEFERGRLGSIKVGRRRLVRRADVEGWLLIAEQSVSSKSSPSVTRD